MRITIEIDSNSELEKLSALFKAFKINTVKVIPPSDLDIAIPLSKGNKKIDPQGLFGIWASSPRSLESIRKDAWQRNQPIG
ncbi:hypothetical protein [Olivibacter sitiensis]|uniref:hypothetical protein n=1 Tax=Olivibacter sitiensis TaxID=376470 RepID=UPI00040941C6|nr:hypothetical protein [Olivibacter sitiensis]